MMDNALPIPRNINAKNTNFKVYKEQMLTNNMFTQIKMRHFKFLYIFLPDKFCKPFGKHEKASLLKCKTWIMSIMI